MKMTQDDSIVGIIGTNCSSAAEAAMALLSPSGYVLISPSNTAPRLTDPDASYEPGYFRVSQNDLMQGQLTALFAYEELGVRQVATIRDSSPYSQGLVMSFAETFTEMGGTVVYDGFIDIGQTDMSDVLTAAAVVQPELIYLPVFEPEGNFLMAQARETDGLEETEFITSDGLLADSFPEATGDAAIGLYLSASAVTGPAYDDLLDKWLAEFGTPPPSGFHAHAYDATNMLFAAIERVAVVADDGTLYIGRQALRDALTNTRNFPGVTGMLTCNEYGDCASGEALGIYQITEAEVEGNWPPPLIYQPEGPLSDLLVNVFRYVWIE